MKAIAWRNFKVLKRSCGKLRKSLRHIIWQGQSCNGALTQGRGRGTIILGTKGSVVMDRNGYTIYDLKNAVVKESIDSEKTDGMNLSADDKATDIHIENFLNPIDFYGQQ